MIFWISMLFMVSADLVMLQYLYRSSDCRSLHAHLLSAETAIMPKKANSVPAGSALADTANRLLLPGVPIDAAMHPIMSGTSTIETYDDGCTSFVS